MKQKFTLAIVAFLFFLSSSAQNITNGGFETWTGNPSHPTGWCSPESLAGLSLGLLSKDQTVSGHVEGLSAAKLKTDSAQTPFGMLLLNGFLSLGTGSFDAGATDPSTALNYYGTPFAFRPDSIMYSYKYAPVASDNGEAAVYLLKNGNDVGGGSFNLASTAGNWMTKTQEIVYVNTNIPDTLFVFFNASAGDSATKNSTLWVDGVKFIYVTPSSVGNEIASTLEISVGPNPATCVLNLFSEKNIFGSTVEVLDVQGKLVMSSILEKNQLNVSSLQNGNYFLRMTNVDGKISTGRFSMMK